VYGILVISDYVNISGFTIQNATIGIYLKSSNNLIENNIFENNSNAVFIKDNSDNKVYSNIFKSNNEGIYIYNSTGNNITKNLILDGSYFGIKFLEKSIKNIFSFNTITDCIKCVTIDRWSNNNTISNNNFSSIQRNYCIDIKNSFYNQIYKNSFNNWSRAITLTKSQNNTISNNTFYNNNVGIYLEDAEFNDISEDNIFLENNVDIKTKSKPPSIKLPGFEVSILIIIAIAIMLIFFYRLRKS
jgi:nitrous oxidase accessory protein